MKGAILKITPQFVTDLFFTRTHIVRISSVLPNDAKFVRSWLDDDGSLALLYKSTYFKDVTEGARFPNLQLPTVITIHPCPSCGGTDIEEGEDCHCVCQACGDRWD